METFEKVRNIDPSTETSVLEGASPNLRTLFEMTTREALKEVK